MTHAEEWYLWCDVIFHNLDFLAADNNFYLIIGLTNRNVSHASYVNDDSIYSGIGGNNTTSPGYIIGYTRIYDGGALTSSSTSAYSSNVYQEWDSKLKFFMKGSKYAGDVGNYIYQGDGKATHDLIEDTSITWTAGQSMNLFAVIYAGRSNVNLQVEVPAIHLLSTDRASNPLALNDLFNYPPTKVPFDYDESWTYTKYDLDDSGWVYV